MNLTIPTVSTTFGPEYAVEVNSSLTTIDAHDHSTGSGVPITPSGMNINSDFTFNANNAIQLRSTRFSAQTTPLSLPADVGALYVAGVDLYYNDVNGNQIRVTQSGGIAGSPGSITNLTSPATATYVSASTKFVWQSGVNLAADLDFRSALLRNASASSFALTLNPPAAMGGNFSLTLPSLPGSTSFVLLDASGNFGASIPSANGITRQNLAAVGQQISSTSSLFSSSSSGFVTVTGLSVTITTTGRPVVVALQASESAGSGSFFSARIGTAGGAEFAFARDGSRLGVSQLNSGGSPYPPGMFTYLDTPSSGTYTYTLLGKSLSGVFTLFETKLVAYEL